jgi:hypothetical protein
MIYLENDFYSNFSSIVESNDDKTMRTMLVDQISNLIAYRKKDLVNLFNKIGLKVSNKPTNKELSDIISKNIKTNKKLQVGLAYLIAENNNLLQQEIKKSRKKDDLINSFEGDRPNTNIGINPKPEKEKKPIDWGKSADAVTAIAGSISVLADSLTQAKMGSQFGSELNDKSNVKSPEELLKEEEERKLAEAKKKRRKRNIIIGVVVLAVGITAFVAYKKGWLTKKVNQ